VILDDRSAGATPSPSSLQHYLVDLWVARVLLAQGMSPDQVHAILRLGSPLFPRRHSHPEDYLRRTVARAFPSPAPHPTCVRLMPKRPP